MKIKYVPLNSQQQNQQPKRNQGRRTKNSAEKELEEWEMDRTKTPVVTQKAEGEEAH